MAKSKDKKKRLDNDALREAGAVGFNMADVRQIQEQQESVNAEAYAKMVEAMSVSANYMGDTISDEGEVRMDDVYPTTLEETLKMDALLDESERAVKDENDEEYNKMIKELRGIVGWSRKRHYNFSWIIILGTLITVGVVMSIMGGAQNEKDSAKRALEKVKAWDADKDTIGLQLALDSVEFKGAWAAPIYYKAYHIKNNQHRIEDYTKSAEDYHMRADTASSRDSKKHYKELAKKYEKKTKEATKNLEECEKWDLKDAKKAAVKERKFQYRIMARMAFIAYIFAAIFILLIPLYIFATHAWGYNITKYREENEKLDKIKKWGFSVAAGLFGAAAAMDYLPDTKVTTYYSDGSTSSHTEGNAFNYIILAIKIGLLILAIAIIAAVSTGILIYSTIVGLKRNYDWKAIYAEAKARGGRAKDFALEKGAEAKAILSEDSNKKA